MNIKSKRERREKFTYIIGEYSVEILSECIRILKRSHNYTFIYFGFKVKYLDDPNAYYANNIKNLIDQVYNLTLYFFLNNV